MQDTYAQGGRERKPAEDDRHQDGPQPPRPASQRQARGREPGTQTRKRRGRRDAQRWWKTRQTLTPRKRTRRGGNRERARRPLMITRWTSHGGTHAAERHEEAGRQTQEGKASATRPTGRRQEGDEDAPQKEHTGRGEGETSGAAEEEEEDAGEEHEQRGPRGGVETKGQPE